MSHPQYPGYLPQPQGGPNPWPGTPQHYATAPGYPTAPVEQVATSPEGPAQVSSINQTSSTLVSPVELPTPVGAAPEQAKVPPIGLRIATTVLIGLIVALAIFVHAPSWLALMRILEGREWRVYRWAVSLALYLGLLVFGAVQIMRGKPNTTVPAIMFLSLGGAALSLLENRPWEHRLVDAFNPIAPRWMPDDVPWHSALLVMILAAGVLTIIVNMQFRPARRPGWIPIGLVVGIIEFVAALRFFGAEAIRLMAGGSIYSSLLPYASNIMSLVAWGTYLAAVANPASLLPGKSRQALALLGASVGVLIPLLWSAYSFSYLGLRTILYDPLAWALPVLALVAVLPASSAAWLKGTWKPAVRPVFQPGMPGGYPNAALSSAGAVPMPGVVGGPVGMGSQQLQYLGSMDPRLVNPALPSGSGTFWLSFFFGPFGYLSASSNKQTAMMFGIVTDYYNGQWIKGWLIGIAVGIGTTILIYLVMFGMLTGAMYGYR